MSRGVLLEAVAARILKLPFTRIAQVAIDGVDGVGKTTFADEIAVLLTLADRPVIRASVDSFHNPREARYRLGPSSPLGFYNDSYDYDRLKTFLLDPLRPGGSARFRRAAFDHRSDRSITSPVELAEPSSILIIDGIFLHRPALRSYWDFSVFLHADFSVSIPRGASRGEGSPDPNAPSNRRYVEGQKLYLSECQPMRYASMTINNNDLTHPTVA